MSDSIKESIKNKKQHIFHIKQVDYNPGSLNHELHLLTMNPGWCPRIEIF